VDFSFSKEEEGVGDGERSSRNSSMLFDRESIFSI
jgi:hypothetical protein